MATQFEIDCALMAGASYYDARADINRIPLPQHWGVFSRIPQDKSTGFEASAFISGSQIVISFTGTDQFSDWTSANMPLAFGLPSTQLYQAAQYYLDIKAANPPGAVISFTGHSLGGGLAALMGILFDEKAVTFDQAPFANAAKIAIRDDLIAYLTTGHGYTTDTLGALAPELFSYGGSGTRTANVSGYYVQGEALQYQPFSTIGSQTILNQTGLGLLGSVSLHSIALLNAFLENKGFEDVTAKLPDLLAMVFDSNLFAHPTDTSNTKFENFLERIVRHEVGVGATTIAPAIPADAMLDRFTSDLWKLAQDGGMTLKDGNSNSTWVSQALTAFAMQKYYEETQGSAGYKKELFTDLATEGGSGGIRFDMADVSEKFATALSQNARLNLTDAKGFDLYLRYFFDNNLDVNDVNFTLAEDELILSRLPFMRDWFVQAGAGGMTATDTLNRSDFVLGGTGNDTLTGGDKTDLLVGNAGADTLTGGKGNDTLIGGMGFDTYIFNAGDGFDTVLDRDGAGIVQLGSLSATGSAGLTDATKWMQLGTDTWVDSANGIVYSKSIVAGETQLLIHKGNGNIVVKGWSDNELGIVLGTGSTPDVTPLAPTLIGDFKKAIDTHGTPDTGDDTYVMTAGNYTPDGDQADALDLISGTAGNDVIDGQGGDDALSGMAGDDTIQGGAGNDVIQGGLGKDTLNGGAGNDIIYGSSDLDLIKPTDVNFTKPINEYPSPLGTGFNWTAGYYSTFANGVPDSYHNSPRNRLDGDLGNRIDGGAGDDFIAAGTGADYVHGGTGKDLIWGMDQDDVLFGDDNNDWIYGDGNQPGGDSVVWALPQNHGNDIIDGGEGDDYLFGQGKDDIIFGGTGNDRIWGDDQSVAALDPTYHGNDYLEGGDGNDQIIGGGKDDTLIGGDGNDTLWGDDGVANLPEQYHGNDILLGGTGDDKLYGGGGNDVLDGGEGNDQLYGGAGDDTYLNVEAGDVVSDLEGHNTIQLYAASGVSTTVPPSVATTSDATLNIVLDDGTNLALQSALYGMDATIQFANGDAIDLESWVSENLTQSVALNLNNIQLDSGAAVTRAYGGVGNDQIQGAVGDDNLKGYGGDDIILGRAGNDLIVGGAGNDILEGGDGNDTLEGGDGADRLMGDGVDSLVPGDDTLFGGAGNDQLWGQGGNDTLFGGADADELQGGDGNDILEGGTGDDILLGEAGDDTYGLNLGDGTDYLSDTSGINRIVFGADILPENLLVTLGATVQGQQSVVIKYSIGDSVTLGRGTSATMQYEFADGNVLAYSALLASLTTPAYSAQDSTLYGTQSGETLSLSTNGINRIVAGGGDDYLYGNSDNNTFEGGSGDDTLYGNNGDDLLRGGLGKDQLEGGSGNDTYWFGRGDGQDTITDYRAEGEVNTLQFGTDILASDVTYIHDASGDLLIRINGTQDSITLVGWYTSASPQLDKIVYGDGSEADLAQLATLTVATLVATEPGILIGTDYNDVLIGSSGNDTLDGGLGSDTLMGGEGVDTYTLGWARGNPSANNNWSVVDPDTVIETDGGLNIIKLPMSLEFSNLEIVQRGNDLYVGIKGSRNVDYFNLESYDNSNSYGFKWATPAGMLIKDYFDGTQNWQVKTAVGEVIPLMDLYLQSFVPPENFAHAYTDWLASARQAIFADYTLDYTVSVSGTKQTGTDSFERISDEGRWTYDLEYFQHYSDEAWYERYTDPARYSYTPTGSYTKLVSGDSYVPTLTYTDGSVTATPLYDYGHLDSYGRPSFVGFIYVNYGGSENAFNSRTYPVTVTTGETYQARVIETVYAGDSDNVLYLWGTAAAYGGGGNDVILTLGSSEARPAGNFLDGGDGDDVVFGSWDNDVIIAGNGNDYLSGGQGDDSYLINPYNTGVKIIDEVNPAVSMPILGDTVYSNFYNNSVYSVYNTGVYDDVTNSYDDGYYIDSVGGRYSMDTVEFGSGVTVSDLLVTKTVNVPLTPGWEFFGPIYSADSSYGTYRYDTYDSLDITWGDHRQTLRVVLPTHNDPQDFAGGGVGIEFYKFADGTVLTQAQILARGLGIQGSDGNDTLTGYAGNDTLDGGLGADTLFGGLGNDTYIVDDAGDLVTEASTLATEIDTVQSTISYTLGPNVENLTLTGAAVINGVGNELANVLRGNSAINTLDGLDGNDTIYAGDGDTAHGGNGNDTLISQNTASWSFLWGEAGDDILVGGSYSGFFAGGLGNDIITGGLGMNFIWGDDQEWIAGGGGGGNDIITGGNDYDYVIAGVGDDVVYGLGGGDNLSGNQGNDLLYGGAGNDFIYGGQGNDLLDGGSGADTLLGGLGDDTYAIGRGYGMDDVVENDTTAGNTDIAQFLTGVAADQIWFQHVGNNLEASIIGTADKLVVKDWYLGSANHVEQFKTTDGAKTLLDSQVDNLVNAMASFAPPAAGQTTLPADYQSSLAPVIAANWQ